MRECQVCKNCYADDVKHCPHDGENTFHSISGESLLEGKYQLESRIGQGGMGVVYKARHTYLKTSHAIKIILPDLVGNDPQLVTRFRQEALAAAAIRHHNVVNVTDYGVIEGKLPFLVMEFVQGESLHDMLAREKRLAPDRAFEVMSAICMGVGAAHRGGIVHRDLKPLNVIVQEGRPLAEAVKILDFGLAKIKSGELLGSFIQAQTTGLMGSPYYMAPEQWADEEPDARSDIYSLGVMLYQMLAGDVPFKGGSIPAIMKKHLSDGPPDFAALGVNVPPAVEAVVRHALEKERDNRTESTDALIEEFRNALRQQSLQPQMNAAVTVPGGVLPVSTLHVTTQPPQSKVFLNNTSVGQSQTDGSLLLEGIQSGNHHLRVSHDGFEDWQNNITLDGKPQKVVATLLKPAATEPVIAPPTPEPLRQQTQPSVPPPVNPGQSQISLNPAETMKVPMPTMPLISHQSDTEDVTMISQRIATGNFKPPPSTPVHEEEKKKSSPLLLLGGIALAGIIALSIFGIGIYWVFFRSGGVVDNPNNTANTANTSNTANTANTANTNVNANGQNVPPVGTKAEMIEITGGKFSMGRNDGRVEEQPAHEVEVKDFLMDKTEVTNADYEEFVRAEKYRAPQHWKDGKPLPGQEKMPVTFVSLEDAKSFAVWRSKRDSVEYKLPTEEQWEYAARNGDQNNLFPWGNKWEKGKAVLDEPSPKPVGSTTGGQNKWGVVDLIGNVWEWTTSEPKPYPGSNLDIKKSGTAQAMIRGGGAISKPEGSDAITSTRRAGLETNTRNNSLGFRLVREK